MCRLFFLVICWCIACFSALSRPVQTGGRNEGLPPWHEGYMDIHHIATGQGDCVFMILPDGTTWLVDAGDIGLPEGSKWWYHAIPDSEETAGERICNYISRFSPAPECIDYALLSHFHADHIGSRRNMITGEHGYGLSGLLYVGDNIKFGTLVDRDFPEYGFPSRQKIHDECDILDEYFKFTEFHRSRGMEMEKFKVGSRKQFILRHNPGKYKKLFEVRNLCANGIVWTGKGEKTKPMFSGDPELFDENMNSCGFRIRYGDFSYYNCGDIPGGNFPLCKSLERDFESYVSDVCGKITVMKCDHHAATDAVNMKLIAAADPEVFIIPACHREHPYKATMVRMTDPLCNYPEKKEFYITSESSRKDLGEALWKHFKPAGHIVVRVYPGGERYQIFVLDVRTMNVIYSSSISGK